MEIRWFWKRFFYHLDWTNSTLLTGWYSVWFHNQQPRVWTRLWKKLTCRSNNRQPYSHLGRLLSHVNKVDFVKAVSSVETDTRIGMRLLSYSTTHLTRYSQSLNESNSPHHVMDIPLNYPHLSLIESRKLCSEGLMVTISRQQHPYHLAWVFLMSVYLQKQLRNFISISHVAPNSPFDSHESRSGSSEGECDICQNRHPPPERQISISKRSRVD